MVVLITGESGAGKTTVGKLLAEEIKWKFYEGDDFHPARNIEKMKKGIPLTDEDRVPWLKAIRGLINELEVKEENGIITCSALKKKYRDFLLKGTKDVKLVFLYGDYQLIKSRIEKRRHHFFDPRLLKSQARILEEPSDAIKINVDKTPGEITAIIKEEIFS